jgi:hypothetical protein
MKNPFPNQVLEDELICHNYNALDVNYVQNNQDRYLEFMYVPQYYKCFKNIENDNSTHFPINLPLESRFCDENVVYKRGGNNKNPTNLDKRKQKFLIPYCEQSTYDNAIICNSRKCCSRNHQLFMNMTKRSDAMLCGPKPTLLRNECYHDCPNKTFEFSPNPSD